MCQWNVCVKENRHKILNIPEADRRSDAPSPSRSGLGLALKALILTSDLVLISRALRRLLCARRRQLRHRAEQRLAAATKTELGDDATLFA